MVQNNDKTVMGHVDGVRVLVVDDEEGMREMLSLLLGRHGYRVDVAQDGMAALEQLTHRTHDIVLTDVRMPKMGGLALLEKIHAAKLPVTMLMMSAFADLDIAIEALKLGAFDYISKPFKADEILLKLRIAEERQRLEADRERLRAENERLRGSLQQKTTEIDLDIEGIIGKSRRLREVLTMVRKVADYKSTVLLIGPSGTGKELVARALHNLSIRAAEPFVPVNCGAIPETLMESELFGHVKGAFTDARRDKPGLAKEANGGTLFLDEIGELPLVLQVKLLRFLQEEEIRPVGSALGEKVDVRIVAATARNLGEMVQTGLFRQDLYYRLNVLQFEIPSLCERKDDVPLLVTHFVDQYAKRFDRHGMRVSRDALRVLMDYPWPGNIRELENTIERAMVLTEGTLIDVSDLPDKMTGASGHFDLSFLGDNLSIKQATQRIEYELIKKSLEQTGGNRTKASKLLEISHRALLYKIKAFGLK